MTKPQPTTPFSKSAFTKVIEQYDTMLIPIKDKKGNIKFIKKETKIAQAICCIKIMAVIGSCKTLIHLENAFKWFDKVALIHNLPLKLNYYVVLKYKKKKEQILKTDAQQGAYNG